MPPVAEGPYGGVVKLQTMRCLFEAYEHVLSLLETVFTPMFCHSDEVRRCEENPPAGTFNVTFPLFQERDETHNKKVHLNNKLNLQMTEKYNLEIKYL